MGIRDSRIPDGMEDRPMDEADGRMLLRKRDLVDKLGVAKSTVADWVMEFRVFIPTRGTATILSWTAISQILPFVDHSGAGFVRKISMIRRRACPSMPDRTLI
ncbi:MAG: hypothetical protein C7B43_14845 [Sulfobacillus benefaciens]|uniref:SAM-dependent MTase TRM10-type domain-containing protein n=1 Tax=Sulfobacillus benefaciens TaxID=453960 RepID=A0A2T2WV21_9FIRM|nr:MAG: hypothetical protein C7B43_14845 [Sulfobacillus benefaciens]